MSNSSLDWGAFAALDDEALSTHAQRARRATLAAAGQAWLGDLARARSLIGLALQWGAGRREIAALQVLAAYHRLGKAALAGGLDDQALRYLGITDVAGWRPDSDAESWFQAKAYRRDAEQAQSQVIHGSHAPAEAWILEALPACQSTSPAGGGIGFDRLPAHQSARAGAHVVHCAPSSPGAVASAARPLVSILIRSMNRPFLEQALRSVALQAYSGIEVVLIAVTPGHPEPPSHAGPFRVRFIPTGCPLSRPRAANVGLERMWGDYGLFLDDDDWLESAHIARLVEAACANPEAGVVYTGVKKANPDGTAMRGAFSTPFGEPFDALKLLHENYIPIHAALFSRQLQALGCRFDPDAEYYEDWDFWLQAAALGPFVYLPGASAWYRIHQSSGVHHDEALIRRAARRLYDKWVPGLRNARRFGCVGCLWDDEG